MYVHKMQKVRKMHKVHNFFTIITDIKIVCKFLFLSCKFVSLFTKLSKEKLTRFVVFWLLNNKEEIIQMRKRVCFAS